MAPCEKMHGAGTTGTSQINRPSLQWFYGFNQFAGCRILIARAICRFINGLCAGVVSMCGNCGNGVTAV
jgi:hypothetical protein